MSLLLEMALFGSVDAAQHPLNNSITLSSATAALSLVVDLTWNTRYDPLLEQLQAQERKRQQQLNQDPNFAPDYDPAEDTPQFDINHPPPHPLDTKEPAPKFILKYVFLNVPKFIRCLDFDWTVFQDRITAARAEAEATLAQKAQREAQADAPQPTPEQQQKEQDAQALLNTTPSIGFVPYPIPSHFKGGKKSFGNYRMKSLFAYFPFFLIALYFNLLNPNYLISHYSPFHNCSFWLRSPRRYCIPLPRKAPC